MKRRIGFVGLLAALVLIGLANGLYAAVQQGQAEALSLQKGMQHVYLPMVSYGIPAVVPDTTVVLEEETLADLVAVSEDGTTYTFADDSPALDALDTNDVMVGGVSEAAPYGFLRKVTSVTEQGNGQVAVTTSQATLEEAIEDGAFSISQTLSPDDVVQMQQAEGVSLSRRPLAPEGEFFIQLSDVVLWDRDRNPNTTTDQVRADGSLTLEPSFDFNFLMQGRTFQTLHFSMSAEETAELEIYSVIASLSVEARIELAQYYLAPITVWVGSVPVVLTPVLTVYVGVDGSVEVGLAINGTRQETTLTAGLQYDGGSWEPIGENTTSFSVQPPDAFGSLEVRGYIGPSLTLLLYGVTGPEAVVQGYIELEANTSQTPWWEIYAGIDATATVIMQVFSWSVASPTLHVIGFRQLIAAADTPPPVTASPTPTRTPTRTPHAHTHTWPLANPHPHAHAWP